MNKLEITEIKIKNFRSIKESNIHLSQDNILVGKNNIGKTSIIEAFSVFNNKLTLTDVNIALLSKLMNYRFNTSQISENDCVELIVTYAWEDLPIEYWGLLSEINDKGSTQLKISYFIPEPNYPLLEQVNHVKDLLELFIRQISIGSPQDFVDGKETILPSSTSLNKFLPVQRFNLQNAKNDEILMMPIMAFRFVDKGDNSSQSATENQFSEKVSTMISKDTAVGNVFEKLQRQIDSKVTPKMNTLQQDLKSFAYPSNPSNPLKAILTIDEWMQNPKVRISQTFEQLSGFELPLNSQGLGYQNIYNIIARISACFSQMENIGLKNPILFVIEEPEAFTHPQLQHIFIQQISLFIKENSKRLNIPYQLIIISHSPEMAVSSLELNFQLIIGRQINMVTRFINWNSLGGGNSKSRVKLKKLILNYNAEMLFADKLIAYEGNAEKLMFTAIIRERVPQLLSEKIAFIPVGTGFSIYESVISDLEFEKVLLITDNDYKMNIDVSESLQTKEKILTTNANLKYLYKNRNIKLNDIDLNEHLTNNKSYICSTTSLSLKDGKGNTKNSNFKVITQGMNKEYNFLPRTLESALVTDSKINVHKYIEKNLVYDDIENTLENKPYDLNHVETNLLKQGKADFALNSLDLISDKEFTIPDYLMKGLEWLVDNE